MSLSKLSRAILLSACAVFFAAASHARIAFHSGSVVTDSARIRRIGATVTLKNLDTNQTPNRYDRRQRNLQLQRPSSQQVFPRRRKDGFSRRRFSTTSG